MLTPEEKTKIIKKCKLHDLDTGSPEVQIALLTEEIKRLLLHLKKNPKDVHSKRGLLKMVSKRRKLMTYLKEEDAKRYNSIISRSPISSFEILSSGLTSEGSSFMIINPDSIKFLK